MRTWTSAASARPAKFLVACALFAAPAAASDWYVDAVHGNDVNGGASPGDAWRTITHALALAPDAPIGGTQTIHIAPGTYDTALGEAFPIVPRDAFELVGAGPYDTALVGDGTGTIVQAWTGHFIHQYTGPLTLLSGLRLESANYGIDLQSSAGTQYLTVRNCRVLAANIAGVHTSGACSPGCGTTDVTLDHVEIVGCGDGIQFGADTQSPTAKLAIIDSRIVGSTLHGIVESDGGGGTELTLLRTRIHASGGDALWMTQTFSVGLNTTHATLTDCLIAGNVGDGIKAEIPTQLLANSSVRVDVTRSTIADNDHGVEAFVPTSWFPDIVVTLQSSIVEGNVDDLDENPAHPAFTSVSFCDVGDGDFAGANGNFAADPLFVDRVAGDWRLAWASPCIETGDPATPSGALDLAGNPRPIDGDLDTLERFDVGAFEFAPLFLKSSGELGTALTLELWGAPNDATTVYFTRKAFGAAQATPFGELDLDPLAMHVFRAKAVGSGPPKLITRPIPFLSALVGRTFAFQALTRSAAAPLGAAYTNGVEVTFIP
ncbi:MAG: DUF1565 domain-containing protein [Planctomycetes bacterium]|nr:DUF1565 domain-containing protein [Planctomycetota bacterium]